MKPSPYGSWSFRMSPPMTLHRKASLHTASHTCTHLKTTSHTLVRISLSRPPWPAGFQERCSPVSLLQPATGPGRGETSYKPQHGAKSPSVRSRYLQFHPPWVSDRSQSQPDGCGRSCPSRCCQVWCPWWGTNNKCNDHDIITDFFSFTTWFKLGGN